jgi:hypothetical protein
MKKIRYTPDGLFIRDLIIYTAVDNFMEYNPPCKECLIQGMCIREDLAHPTLDSIDSMPDHLHVKTCKKLKDFVLNHKLFFIYG